MKKFMLFFVLLFALAGCQVAPFVGPIVTGVVMWKDGEAHKYYNEESAPMYRHTKSALRELGIPVNRDVPEKNGYYIVAGDRDRFKIHVTQVRPHITKVSIRVNFLGDKPYAELVYKTIDANTDTIEFERGRPLKARGR